MTGLRVLVVAFVFLALGAAGGVTYAQSDLWQTYTNEGKKAYQRGDYWTAEWLLRSALQEAEKSAAQDLRMAESLNNLALLYVDLGKFAEAEPLFKRAITIDEKTLGAASPGLASDLNRDLQDLY